MVAAAAWMRLMMAIRLWRKHSRSGAVLDFGAGTGEIFHFLEAKQPYHFVEAADRLSDALRIFVPHAQRELLDNLPKRLFTCIFALDSLEHNEDVPSIVERLTRGMTPDGILIVSGPTENTLYRLGRKIARFRDHHFHKTTIYDIEVALAQRLTVRASVVSCFRLAPLVRMLKRYTAYAFLRPKNNNKVFL
jgi:2-polyprenyl-3-methyl-5-hydroxy-6-metoxy-1,4-benzoquinol methylase